MSLVLARAALEVALNAMSPSIDYAWENTPYKPVVGTPYAQVHLLAAEPADIEMSGTVHREQGFMQVKLAYPLDAGPAAAATRAELIRATFYRGRSFVSSGVVVTVDRTPEIAPARTEEDRYTVPVKIRFYAHITRAA